MAREGQGDLCWQRDMMMMIISENTIQSLTFYTFRVKYIALLLFIILLLFLKYFDF